MRRATFTDPPHCAHSWQVLVSTTEYKAVISADGGQALVTGAHVVHFKSSGFARATEHLKGTFTQVRNQIPTLVVMFRATLRPAFSTFLFVACMVSRPVTGSVVFSAAAKKKRKFR